MADICCCLRPLPGKMTEIRLSLHSWFLPKLETKLRGDVVSEYNIKSAFFSSSLCTSILKDKIKICKNIIHASEWVWLKVEHKSQPSSQLLAHEWNFLKMSPFYSSQWKHQCKWYCRPVHNSDHHGWNTFPLTWATLHRNIRTRVRCSWYTVYMQYTQQLHSLQSAETPCLVNWRKEQTLKTRELSEESSPPKFKWFLSLIYAEIRYHQKCLPPPLEVDEDSRRCQALASLHLDILWDCDRRCCVHFFFIIA